MPATDDPPTGPPSNPRFQVETMAQLHQIQIGFVAAEDRLLLRIRTQDEAEFRFWLSRRYAKALWPMLVKSLATHPDVAAQSDPSARRTVLSFQHESAVQGSNFETAFDDRSAARPLGDAPILLTRLAMKQANTAAPILCMHPAEGQGVELRLNETLLHSFCRLLGDAVRAADWGFELGITGPTAAPRPERAN